MRGNWTKKKVPHPKYGRRKGRHSHKDKHKSKDERVRDW